MIAAIALLITTWPAAAQWSTNPAVNNAICTLGGEQAIPKIATCSNGDTYIGYFSNESGNYNVRLQRLNAAGNIQWAADGILISNHPQETWLTDWDMTCDGANHAILVFNDIRTGNTNIVAYRISPSGTFVWGDNGIQLSNTTAFNAAPKVTATAAGNIVVAWSADDVSKMQKISPSGSILWGAGGITVSSANRITWPQLMPVGSDEVILKYFNDSGLPNAPTRHVLAQRYDASGTAVWSAPAVISNAGGISAWTQIFPFINDGSDGFYIAWHDDRDNNQRASVFVQHVSGNGQVLFPANGVEASTVATMNHYYPQLALPPGSADIYVFWNEMNTLQSQWGIFGQRISSSGTVQWGNAGMTFIPVSGTNVYPYAARNSGTDMILVYEQYTSSIDGTIKAMRIAPSGSFLWTPAQKDICTVNSQKIHPEVNEFNNNQWIVTWEDSRNGNSDIYAQNIQLDGSLGPVLLGFIQGQVTITGEPADVTQATVSSGGYSTHPDFTGHYSLQVPEGTYTVTATHPYTTTQTIGGVQVTAGIPTTGINFNLTVNRADLIVTAMNSLGILMNNVLVEINGPDGTLNGLISQDTLIFPQVSYGSYSGSATLFGTPWTTLEDTVISAQNHSMQFFFVIQSLNDPAADETLMIQPNPSGPDAVVRFTAKGTGSRLVTVTDATGKICSRVEIRPEPGPVRIPLRDLLQAPLRTNGLYILQIADPQGGTDHLRFVYWR